MTTGQEPSFESVSAYVDGAAAPEVAARISRAAAEDPALAGRIAILQELRVGVSTIDADPPLPEFDRAHFERLLVARHGRSFPWRPAAFGFAAALVVAAVGLAGWVQFGSMASPSQPGLPAMLAETEVARLVAAYDAWSRNASTPTELAGVEPDRLSVLIGATGLRLARTATVPLASGGMAAESDYLGPHGCRLSLFRTPLPGPGPGTGHLTIEAAGDLSLARWTGDASYLLVARAMDRPRFATIADALSTAVQQDASDDGDRLAMLSAARQHCAG